MVGHATGNVIDYMDSPFLGLILGDARRSGATYSRTGRITAV